MIQNLAYAHDRAGNLRTVTDKLGALSQEFFYDDLHRLLGVVGTGSQGYGMHGYVYDPAGNLREKGPVGAAESGRLKLHYSRTPGTPTSVTSVDFFMAETQSWWVGAAAYSYDADGGATAIRRAFSNYALGRNADGRLSGVGLPTPLESLNFHYDPTGARTETLKLGGYGLVLGDRYYVDETLEVDPVDETYQVHVFAGARRVATIERSGLGNTSDGTLDRVITHHPDHVGSNTVSVTTTATSQTTSAIYLDPFGQKLGGSAPTSYVFTDQERDADSGLDYFGARYYDAMIGRFISQDPELIGAQPGVTFGGIAVDSQSFNAFSYVLNRPTRLTDPTGRFPVDWLTPLPDFSKFEKIYEEQKILLTASGDAISFGSTYTSSGKTFGGGELTGDAGVNVPQGGEQGVGRVPDSFEPFVEGAKQMGEALRDSPIRQGAFDGTRKLLPQSVFSKLRDRMVGGVTFDRPSPAAEARFLFGDKDRNVVAMGIGVAADRAGGANPNVAPRSLFNDSAALSVRRGRATPFVWVGPHGNIVLLGQPAAAVNTRFCVTLSGAGGC